ncbi:MAG TPA: hypothetical protein VFF17_02865, partial [Thermoanaerobaculia bacterium]|nr:hypothetical protein [Thermoanaerobaculia bacterium]
MRGLSRPGVLLATGIAFALIAAIALLAQVPMYTITLNDAVTGDNATQDFTVPGVTCNDCYVPDPNPGVDSYTDDIYERPMGSGSGASAYFSNLDITSGQMGSDATYLYFRINLFGAGSGLNAKYAVAINCDADARPDLYLRVDDPQGNMGTTFDEKAVFASYDTNNDVGAANLDEPDGPGGSDNGYETVVFDQGTNSAPGSAGGADAVQARVAPTGTAVEFAIERVFLDAVCGKMAKQVGFCVQTAQGGQTASGTQLLHDEYSRQSGGSPYPWLSTAPSPAVTTCPTTNAEDDALSAQQRAALDSGTNVNTGIVNPCYPSGGNILLHDSACSL